MKLCNPYVTAMNHAPVRPGMHMAAELIIDAILGWNEDDVQEKHGNDRSIHSAVK